MQKIGTIIKVLLSSVLNRLEISSSKFNNFHTIIDFSEKRLIFGKSPNIFNNAEIFIQKILHAI